MFLEGFNHLRGRNVKKRSSWMIHQKKKRSLQSKMKKIRTQLERKHPKLASLGVETEFLVDRKVPREAKLRKDAPPHLKGM